MQRINVTIPHTLEEVGGEVVGWFDIDKATEYTENTRWDGNNSVSLATGIYSDHECLYRTAGGRWVRHWWSRWQGSRPTYHFISEEEAVAWMIRCEYTADDIAEATGQRIEDETGPSVGGRPEIGPAFSVRFPADLLEQVDAAARAAQMTRAGWLRMVAQRALMVAGQ